ncbi:MAG: methyltransferase domain-containing protein [Silicimonas sp.]|nr:methyltransferase domain-containing protein [Silicimonas sp.]
MTELPFHCRNCGGVAAHTFVDLGLSPLANSYVSPADAGKADPSYPLHARVCDACLLVQVDDVVPADEIFSNSYAYFSSFSDSWLHHCERFASAAIQRYALNEKSLVLEIASNDGYLLQFFKSAGIPVLGVEPTANTAAVAIEKSIPTRVDFFGSGLARKLVVEGIHPTLITSANVLAHVPDIRDFASGVALMLEGDAVYTVEFPQLLTLIENAQFDTIYHEHFSYLSLFSTEQVLNAVGLRVFDVETLPTHGGSLRVHACLANASHAEDARVAEQRARESAAGLDTLTGYEGFGQKVEVIRKGLIDYLRTARENGRRVAAYGAAAKGNTLLNYCEVDADAIAYVVDRNPAKQGKLLPGSHIPIKPVQALYDDPPDDILILPWNIKDEVVAQLADLKDRGIRFLVAVPEMTTVS